MLRNMLHNTTSINIIKKISGKLNFIIKSSCKINLVSVYLT